MPNQDGMDIIIRLKDLATRGLKQVTAGVREVGSASDELSSKLKELDVDWNGISRRATLATAAVVAAAGAAADAAANTEQLAQSYGRLTDQAGINGNEMLSDLTRVSAGTISQYDLMLSSNRAMQLGVAKNSDEMVTLLQIARVRSRDMGISVTQAFDNIVTGLGRSSPLILDNLGIVVDATEANDAYAKQFGKTGDQLSEYGRKQALINAVVSQGKKDLEAIGEVTETSADKFSQMKATLKDTRDEIGKDLLPVAVQLATTIRDITRRVAEWVDKNPNAISSATVFAAKLLAVAAATAKIAQGITLLTKGLPVLSATIKAAITTGLAPMAVSAGVLAAGIVALTYDVYALTEAWSLWQQAQNQEVLTDASTVRGVTNAWKNFNAVQKETGNSFRMTADQWDRMDSLAQRDFLRKWGKGAAPTLDDVAKSAAGANSAIGELGMSADDLAKMFSEDSGKGATKAAKDLANSLSALADSSANARDSVTSAMDQTAEAVKNARKALSDLERDRADDTLSAKQRLAEAFTSAQSQSEQLQSTLDELASSERMRAAEAYDERKSMLAEIAAETDSKRKEELQAELDTWDVKEALRKGAAAQEIQDNRERMQAIRADIMRFGSVEESIGAEVMAARDEARKSDLEKAVDAYNRERTEIEAKFEQESESARRAVEVEQEKANRIMAIRDSLESATASFMQRTERVTVESLDRQAEAYDRFADAVSRALNSRAAAAYTGGIAASGDSIFNIYGGSTEDIVRQVLQALDRRSQLVAAGG